MMDRVKQHYVPQFLLRNFTTQDYLFVYDKYTDKTYTAVHGSNSQNRRRKWILRF